MGTNNSTDTEAGKAATSRILVAAARPESAQHYRDLLEFRDHTVQVVSDARAALKATMHKSFDLLLCVVLPEDPEAWQILETLRGRPNLSNLPGISISSSASPEETERSRVAGFAVHLCEPVDAPRLMRMIELIRRGEDPIHSFTRKGS